MHVAQGGGRGWGFIVWGEKGLGGLLGMGIPSAGELFPCSLRVADSNAGWDADLLSEGGRVGVGGWGVVIR